MNGVNGSNHERTRLRRGYGAASTNRHHFSGGMLTTNYADGADLNQTPTSQYDASDRGDGIGSPARRKPSKWNSMASCISRSTLSRVLPVAMQPGRSGEYAE